jgi:cob(I)alamin adenosyltransferase
MKQKLSASSHASQACAISHKYMLYTGKGDNGTTKLFDCPPGVRIRKSAKIFNALGTLDELNSQLGFVKALSNRKNVFIYYKTEKVHYKDVLHKIQQILFSIQAELGGSEISATKEHLNFLEETIREIENVLPPITSFIVPGGGEVGSYLDVARTTARKAEREIVSVIDAGERKINENTIAFMNRLSSILYALARFANYQEGYSEDKPNYA